MTLKTGRLMLEELRDQYGYWKPCNRASKHLVPYSLF